ncbi:hypothetical protein PPEP_a0165 [Pseudoalteromonas peptidolytica F12-50-A1]|uniref:Uncharacterized protein n=1 Tax=Pseudoalteromonas peptidolytica F12-50-A1 TaxID=1315280 RepID=A0A8I0T3K5_9GAMM|nr:hypothetical protein [Pseudoalteromonas peptidolytica F12-50-A1]
MVLSTILSRLKTDQLIKVISGMDSLLPIGVMMRHISLG